MLSGLMAPPPASASHASTSWIVRRSAASQARFSPIRTPYRDRSLCSPHLCVAAGKGEQIAHVVGMKVSQKYFIEHVDWQLQAREVRECATPEVENQEVMLGVTDFDEDAGRGLTAGDPSITTAGTVTRISPVSSSSSPGTYISAFVCLRLSDNRRCSDSLSSSRK